MRHGPTIISFCSNWPWFTDIHGIKATGSRKNTLLDKWYMPIITIFDSEFMLKITFSLNFVKISLILIHRKRSTGTIKAILYRVWKDMHKYPNFWLISSGPMDLGDLAFDDTLNLLIDDSKWCPILWHFAQSPGKTSFGLVCCGVQCDAHFFGSEEAWPFNWI